MRSPEGYHNTWDASWGSSCLSTKSCQSGYPTFRSTELGFYWELGAPLWTRTRLERLLWILMFILITTWISDNSSYPVKALMRARSLILFHRLRCGKSKIEDGSGGWSPFHECLFRMHWTHPHPASETIAVWNWEQCSVLAPKFKKLWAFRLLTWVIILPVRDGQLGIRPLEALLKGLTLYTPPLLMR